MWTGDESGYALALVGKREETTLLSRAIPVRGNRKALPAVRDVNTRGRGPVAAARRREECTRDINNTCHAPKRGTERHADGERGIALAHGRRDGIAFARRRVETCVVRTRINVSRTHADVTIITNITWYTCTRERVRHILLALLLTGRRHDDGRAYRFSPVGLGRSPDTRVRLSSGSVGPLHNDTLYCDSEKLLFYYSNVRVAVGWDDGVTQAGKTTIDVNNTHGEFLSRCLLRN